MEIVVIWIILASYLALGALFLVVFQLTTHRISQRLHDVSVDIMMKLATERVGLVTQKLAVAITLIYAWVFWVAVLIGYLSDRDVNRLEKK